MRARGEGEREVGMRDARRDQADRIKRLREDHAEKRPQSDLRSRMHSIQVEEGTNEVYLFESFRLGSHHGFH